MKVRSVVSLGLPLIVLAGCTRAQWQSFFSRSKPDAKAPQTTADVVRANTTTVDYELRRANIEK